MTPTRKCVTSRSVLLLGWTTHICSPRMKVNPGTIGLVYLLLCMRFLDWRVRTVLLQLRGNVCKLAEPCGTDASTDAVFLLCRNGGCWKQLEPTMNSLIKPLFAPFVKLTSGLLRRDGCTSLRSTNTTLSPPTISLKEMFHWKKMLSFFKQQTTFPYN